MKNVAFIGQDDDEISEDSIMSLYKVLRVMMRLGAENIYCGFDTDWDKYCIGMVEHLRGEYPQLKLDIIIHCGGDMQLLRRADCCVCYLGGAAEKRRKKIMLLAESRSIPVINLYDFVEHFYMPSEHTI